jgi:hypothetical protein
MGGSIVGLLAPLAVYGRETEILFNTAIAQDLVNGLLVAPLIVVLAVFARRGRLKAWLALIGFLAFTVYNYFIYALSIQFGPLFLAWVAVLGLAMFALIGSIATAMPLAASSGQAPSRLAGGVLVVTSFLFALLWLSEAVQDLLAGARSVSAEQWNVPTNPVHVLDLAFFLPAAFASGVLIIRRHRLGQTAAIGALTFLGLTTLPILVTPIVNHFRGDTAGWWIMVPVGALAVVVWATLLRQARSVGAPAAHRGQT